MSRATVDDQGLARGRCAGRLARSLALLVALLPGAAWTHDGKTHSDAGRWAALSPQGPVATEVASASAAAGDEARARRYFTDLPVRNQDGEELRFYSDVLRNRVVLINFLFTHCESGCPVATRQLAAVSELLGERFGQEVFFISLSTDAERDTPEALKHYALTQGAYQPGWIFLTGEKAHMDHIIQKLGQFNPDPEQHSMLLLAANLSTRHWVKLRPNSPARALALQLSLLADEQVDGN